MNKPKEIDPGKDLWEEMVRFTKEHNSLLQEEERIRKSDGFNATTEDLLGSINATYFKNGCL